MVDEAPDELVTAFEMAKAGILRYQCTPEVRTSLASTSETSFSGIWRIAKEIETSIKSVKTSTLAAVNEKSELNAISNQNKTFERGYTNRYPQNKAQIKNYQQNQHTNNHNQKYSYQHSQQQRGHNQQQLNKNQQYKQQQICSHCGYIGHLEKDCYWKQRRCFKCGAIDHFVRDCPLN
ncbi:MAG: hypothetical protein KDC92_17170 [Bacteroidetes bacterium]|nr:hypothetical protein [Bacteroidota bacterium]